MKAALIGINLDTGDIMSQIFDGDKAYHCYRWPGYVYMSRHGRGDCG